MKLSGGPRAGGFCRSHAGKPRIEGSKNQQLSPQGKQDTAAAMKEEFSVCRGVDIGLGKNWIRREGGAVFRSLIRNPCAQEIH
jgi:hypothetical protein